MTSGASGTLSIHREIPNRCLVDSGILVQHLRGNAQAAKYLTSLRRDFTPCISAATAAELLVGCANEKQVQVTADFLQTFEILPIDFEVARYAAVLIRKYPAIFGKEIARGFADALIAATAWSHNLVLHTLNVRHFARVTIAEIQIHSIDQTAIEWK
ncbi:MAG: type II toxin-antitoxin system VapC family toxin [Chloroflexi bacterium]|nr:type II toxin-antitoxin system VapC family toxin [Chloroflexota bacterium]